MEFLGHFFQDLTFQDLTAGIIQYPLSTRISYPHFTTTQSTAARGPRPRRSRGLARREMKLEVNRELSL